MISFLLGPLTSQCTPYVEQHLVLPEADLALVVATEMPSIFQVAVVVHAVAALAVRRDARDGAARVEPDGVGAAADGVPAAVSQIPVRRSSGEVYALGCGLCVVVVDIVPVAAIRVGCPGSDVASDKVKETARSKAGRYGLYIVPSLAEHSLQAVTRSFLHVGARDGG